MGDNIHADFLHELLSSTCVPVMFYITDCFLGKIDNRSTTISSNLQCQEEWKLDSSASHRNWFISYQSIDDGVVFMGNGIPCKIFGVGSSMVLLGNQQMLDMYLSLNQIWSHWECWILVDISIQVKVEHSHCRKVWLVKYSNMPTSSIVSHQIRILD